VIREPLQTLAEETNAQLLKAPKKSQSNRKQITKATLVASKYLHRLRKERIAKEAAAAARKQCAATKATKSTTAASTKKKTTTTSKKRTAAAPIDKVSVKRTSLDDSAEDESESTSSESGGATPPPAAAPGLSQNSTNKPALGKPQNDLNTPLRRSTRVTRTRKDFFVSSTTRRQSFLTIYPGRRIVRRTSQTRRDIRGFTGLHAVKFHSNSKACPSLCSRAMDKRSLYLDGDNFCGGGLDGMRRVGFRL
jgi:hypothetical protein